MMHEIKQWLSAYQPYHQIKASSSILLALLVGLSQLAIAQQNKVIYKLSKPSVTKGLPYYIVELEDLRKETNTIGRIINFGSENTLQFDKKANQALFEYFTAAAPSNAPNQLPIYFKIIAFNINEKKVSPNKITGTVHFQVAYSWFRDAVPVELTTFNMTVNFSRPSDKPIYEEIISKSLNQSVVYLQDWIYKNKGKNTALTQNLIIKFKDIFGSNESDTIFYRPERPLKWTDFQGNSNRISKFAAAVFSSISYEGNSSVQDNNLIIEIGLKTFMVKENSWVKSSTKDLASLKHEQLHFDLTRIAADKFKQRLLKADLSIDDYDSEIQYQFLEAFKEMNTLQKQYDQETSHGINASSQAAWEKKIEREIREIYKLQN